MGLTASHPDVIAQIAKMQEQIRKLQVEIVRRALTGDGPGEPPTGAAGGDLAGSYPNPDIGSGVIVNADINGAAAIAYTKLALTNAIVDADIAASGISSRSKLPDKLAYKDETNVFTLANAFAALATFRRASATDNALAVRLDADAQPRLRVQADGLLSWSDGTDSGDVTFYRSGVGQARLTAALATIRAAGVSAYASFVSGDADFRWQMNSDGEMEWGDGAGAPDTKLYRPAANELKTDDKLIVALDLQVLGTVFADTIKRNSSGPLTVDGDIGDVEVWIDSNDTDDDHFSVRAGSGLTTIFRVEGDGATGKFGLFGVTPVNRPGSTEELKAALASLGLLTDGGASPLDLDGGKATVGDAKIEGHIYQDAEYDNGSSGTSKTVDWKNGNLQKVSMTGNCTFTFTAPDGVGHFSLKLTQDGTGGRTVTWPATLKWVGGTVGVLSTGANDVDVLTVRYDGTNYQASLGNDFS